MTTIAFRDGIVAADRKCNSNGAMLCQSQKVFQNAAGDVMAIAGNLNAVFKIVKWFLAGEKGQRPSYMGEGDCCVIFRTNGNIEHIGVAGDCEIELRDDLPFYSFGSGALVAMGRMIGGGTAEEAILAASLVDVFTGSDVDTVQVRKLRKARR